MIPPLNNLADIEAWTAYLRGLVAWTGNPALIEAFTWSEVSKLTVGDYRTFLDAVEDTLRGYDWAALSAQLPLYRQIMTSQGVPADQIDLVIGLLEDFISGNLGMVLNGFDEIRDFLSPYPGSASLLEVLDGSYVPDTDDGLVFTGDGSDEEITGTDAKDKLKGAGGDDMIEGLGGNDKVFGGSGGDALYGGGGKDKLLGGGNNDKIKGDAGNDLIKGDAGGDKLYGGGGKDKIFGGDGGDKLFGGGGADVLDGGKGRDVLVGGNGPDEFHFSTDDGRDRIKDFEVGEDRMFFAGATSLDDLTFKEKAAKGWTSVSFDGTTVLVEGVTEAELAVTDNFIGF